MRGACQDLSVMSVEAGHWLPLENKMEISQAIGSWIGAKKLGPIAR
jgi:hypothetical protein